ncbi:hypothetical protein HU200_058662 [Digitaria exilis]|uniref:Uncharacterized protein n=1 Tax=Digitaria exilis TaxID=1010633 RepID=A0A835E3W2_9POAL|nr:hypothetical protein HU200_058662 [Digitaria exilis]
MTVGERELPRRPAPAPSHLSAAAFDGCSPVRYATKLQVQWKSEKMSRSNEASLELAAAARNKDAQIDNSDSDDYRDEAGQEQQLEEDITPERLTVSCSSSRAIGTETWNRNPTMEKPLAETAMSCPPLHHGFTMVRPLDTPCVRSKFYHPLQIRQQNHPHFPRILSFPRPRRLRGVAPRVAPARPPSVSLTTYGRCLGSLAASRRGRHALAGVIQRKRARLDDEDIIDNVMFMMVAALLTFMIRHLEASRDAYGKVVTEQAEITRRHRSKGDAEALSWEDLGHMSYTWGIDAAAGASHLQLARCGRRRRTWSTAAMSSPEGGSATNMTHWDSTIFPDPARGSTQRGSSARHHDGHDFVRTQPLHPRRRLSIAADQNTIDSYVMSLALNAALIERARNYGRSWWDLLPTGPREQARAGSAAVQTNRTQSVEQKHAAVICVPLPIDSPPPLSPTSGHAALSPCTARRARNVEGGVAQDVDVGRNKPVVVEVTDRCRVMGRLSMVTVASTTRMAALTTARAASIMNVATMAMDVVVQSSREDIKLSNVTNQSTMVAETLPSPVSKVQHGVCSNKDSFLTLSRGPAHHLVLRFAAIVLATPARLRRPPELAGRAEVGVAPLAWDDTWFAARRCNNWVDEKQYYNCSDNSNGASLRVSNGNQPTGGHDPLAIEPRQAGKRSTNSSISGKPVAVILRGGLPCRGEGLRVWRWGSGLEEAIGAVEAPALVLQQSPRSGRHLTCDAQQGNVRRLDYDPLGNFGCAEFAARFNQFLRMLARAGWVTSSRGSRLRCLGCALLLVREKQNYNCTTNKCEGGQACGEYTQLSGQIRRVSLCERNL